MPRHRMLRLSRPTATAVVLVAASVVLLLSLGAYPLWDPDEGRHAEVAREVYEATDWRHWVTPRLNHEPYREKPILFYWAVAAAYALVGVNELGARLVSALAALATVMAVYGWSVPRHGPRAAMLAALVLVTTVEFAALGRFANLDMLLTCFVTAGILAGDRWSAGGRVGWLLAAATAAALGTLTKGLVAPVLIGTVTLAQLAMTGRLARVRLVPMLQALGVFVVLAAPWHLVAAAVDPVYLRQLYLEGHVGRFVGTERTLHHEPFWYYVPILLGGFFPWSALLPATAAATPRDDDARLCAVWAVVVFLFFSASESKVGTYILPCFPPLAVLTGRALDALLAGEPAARALRLTRAGLWLVVVVLVVAPLVLIVLARREWDGALASTSLMALPLIPLGVALALLLRQGRVPRALVVLAAGAAVVLAGFYRFAAPPVSQLTSAAPLAAAIAARVPTHDAVPVIAYAIRAPSLMFYLRRPIIHLARWRPVRKLVAAHPLVLVVTSARHRETIARAGVTEPWYRGGRREVWGSQPSPDRLDSSDAPER